MAQLHERSESTKYTALSPMLNRYIGVTVGSDGKWSHSAQLN